MGESFEVWWIGEPLELFQGAFPADVVAEVVADRSRDDEAYDRCHNKFYMHIAILTIKGAGRVQFSTGAPRSAINPDHSRSL